MAKELKISPSSQEAEEALLGCIIQGGEKEQEIAMAWIRDNSAFYITDNRIIWESMAELYKDGVSIDFVTLTNKVKDKTGDSKAYYITGLTESFTSTVNVESYARIVWEKYIQRETAKSAQALLNASYDDYRNVGSILEKHSKLIEELRHIQPSKQRDIGVLVDEMKATVEEDSN